jgi:hypothetical protein
MKREHGDDGERAETVERTDVVDPSASRISRR